MNDDPVPIGSALALHDLNNLVQAVLPWLDASTPGLTCQDRIVGVRAAIEPVLAFLRQGLDGLLAPEGTCDERVVEGTLGLVAPQTSETLTLRATLPQEGVRFGVGAVVLQRILLNLLLNALDAVGEHGTITLTVRNLGECVQIDVCDDGPGVGSDTSTGRGLGLPGARLLAERVGGSLGMLACEGGACFRLEVPRAA
ncbi:MAG: ATP-binding protein [Alphaproteobacteria bacterium]|nr:ATP-binding protein [Alphaproteobacteria bacterium]